MQHIYTVHTHTCISILCDSVSAHDFASFFANENATKSYLLLYIIPSFSRSQNNMLAYNRQTLISLRTVAHYVQYESSQWDKKIRRKKNKGMRNRDKSEMANGL